jgi:hypothetical protein
VELRYDLGSSQISIVNPVNITGGHDSWHTVSIIREEKEATLTVDSTSVSGSSEGTATHLNLPSGAHMFVGGILVNSADLLEYDTILDGDFSMGLKGCIENLVVNDVTFNLEDDAIDGANVGRCDEWASAGDS